MCFLGCLIQMHVLATVSFVLNSEVCQLLHPAKDCQAVGWCSPECMVVL